jgi:hypothetical protein
MLGGLGVKIWGYIAAAGGALLAVLMFWNKAKNAGRKEVKDAVNAKTTEKVIDMVKKAKKNEDEIRSTPLDVKRNKLRGYTSKTDS